MAYPSKFIEFHGPCAWKTMHTIAHNFAAEPTEPTTAEKQAAEDFFNSLAILLPCEGCREHYAKYIKQHPVDVSSRHNLARWVYDLHSEINARRHVPNLSFEEVEDIYAAWTKPKANQLAALGTQARYKALADPHFGKPIVRHDDTTGDHLGTIERSLIFLAVGSVAGLGYYLWDRHAHSRDKNEIA
jgi:hypothetical protein